MITVKLYIYLIDMQNLWSEDKRVPQTLLNSVTYSYKADPNQIF